jgi:hypothetical protein
MIRARLHARRHQRCDHAERGELFDRIGHEIVPSRYKVTMPARGVTALEKN